MKTIDNFYIKDYEKQTKIEDEMQLYRQSINQYTRLLMKISTIGNTIYQGTILPIIVLKLGTGL